MASEWRTPPKESKRKRLEILRTQLEQERASFISHWRELGEYILPRRPRFMVTDNNKGDRRNQKIIDGTATYAARTLRSGMMAGVTSPARPWFRLTTPDPELSEFGRVKEWLHLVEQRQSTNFLRSNLYNVLPIIYGDIGVFGTGAMMIEPDKEDVLRCYPFAVGSYSVANDHRLRVNTFTRDFRMTVRQIVEAFGNITDSGRIDWSNFSTQVRDHYENGRYQTWVDVTQVIMPNDEYDRGKLRSKYKKFSSVYYEKGSVGSSGNYLRGNEEDRCLSEKGYDYFPVLCPRWETTGEDSYGTDCPGMLALGDIKALQLLHKRKSQAIEKMVFPSMVAPTSLKNAKASLLPGDITFSDEREGMRGIRPIHEVNPRIQEVLLDIQDHQGRIKKYFFEDLFLMLASSDRRQITAREIDERHEEKLLALGPVLEQLNQDLLDPLIDISFDIMMKAGQVPPPPKELEGVKLKVEYVSVMAQAQKLVGIAGIERFLGFAGQLAQYDPKVLHKIDFDQTIDVYGDITSIPPGIIRSDEEVAAMRQQIDQAAAQQQQAQQAQMEVDAAQKLSQTPLNQESALDAMLEAGVGGGLLQ